jgi:flagellar basal-body rod protein FlgF
MDIVANNIANADTNGFKFESLMTKETPARPASTSQGPNPVKFVTSAGVARDFGQGNLRRTDGNLDLAIDGKGFFKVTTKAGERFTRDGHFRTDDTGRVTTQSGAVLADEGGGEITIDPTKSGEITISPDGVVSQGSERIGKVGVFSFGSLSALEKTGDNLYQNASNQPAVAAPDANIRQGMLESSNVNPIVQITRMIEVNRAYESVTQMMSAQSDLSRNSVARLGRLQ